MSNLAPVRALLLDNLGILIFDYIQKFRNWLPETVANDNNISNYVTAILTVEGRDFNINNEIDVINEALAQYKLTPLP